MFVLVRFGLGEGGWLFCFAFGPSCTCWPRCTAHLAAWQKQPVPTPGLACGGRQGWALYSWVLLRAIETTSALCQVGRHGEEEQGGRSANARRTLQCGALWHGGGSVRELLPGLEVNSKTADCPFCSLPKAMEIWDFVGWDVQPLCSETQKCCWT